MKMIDKLKKLPENKKKTVSAIIALCLTILISGSWFAFSPKKNNNSWDVNGIVDDVKATAQDDAVQQSFDQFTALRNEIFGTTTSTSTNATSTDESTTTASSTNINNQN